ncbi:MAG: beta-ketoacyl synthase, N-terminal domain protein [Herbaspirillum sp.]|nr:beta-ketoacyl synthase, N-terminal domain protein [Herbaspirillum sp.]
MKLPLTQLLGLSLAPSVKLAINKRITASQTYENNARTSSGIGHRKPDVTRTVDHSGPQRQTAIRFSVAAHAAWAPGLQTEAAWRAWADADADFAGAGEPPLPAMPPMLRRRASPAGKLALQAAYDALGERSDIPAIFCSRHGECGRAADLLADLAQGLPMSPASFSLSVHNAAAGLFSIARRDHANSLALAAGHSTVEHAAIEACGLLADGAPAVLLVAADGPLPAMYREMADCKEQSFGWAWLLQAPADDAISLRWSRADDTDADIGADPAGLQILRFFLRGDTVLRRTADRRQWTWGRDE